jgi:branched-chain amino acid transport system permease protein
MNSAASASGSSSARERRSFREGVSALPKPAKVGLMVLAALLAYALPLLEPPGITTPGTDFGGVLFTVAVYMLVALGLNIVVGYAGLLDLGYVAFYAVGAYTVAVLTSEHGNWPYLLTIPMAVGVAMLSGLALGAPTLRVRGDYLAIVTLGFGEIVRPTGWELPRVYQGSIGRPVSNCSRSLTSIGIQEYPCWIWGRPRFS